MRVLIVDDHDLVRGTVAAFLEAAGGFEIETSPDLPDALSRTEAGGPWDLVLLDYAMPGMDGLAGLGRMLEANGGKGVALMSGTASRTVAEAALAGGAIGFLPKSMAAGSLVNAVRFMGAGERFVPVDFLNAAPAEPGAGALSAREREVLDGLCRGLANKEIARELDLQEVTVKLHVKTLCRKLEARNRTHAAIIARDRGLA
jgi:DNA-binding NarL/FixJ family response regulator